MDGDTLGALARLVRKERVAALGTLRQGAPLVSMVAYLAHEDFGSFHLRVSRLAWHTQDMAREPRVSLAITQTDDGRADPQTLMRVALRGEARPLEGQGAELERLEQAWLARFPRPRSPSNSPTSRSGASRCATRASWRASAAPTTCRRPTSPRRRAPEERRARIARRARRIASAAA